MQLNDEQKDKSVKINRKELSEYQSMCLDALEGIIWCEDIAGGKSGKAVKEEYYPLLINIHDCQFRYALDFLPISNDDLHSLSSI